MRESRTYGSVRGARDETRVPTATFAVCGICSRPDMALLAHSLSDRMSAAVREGLKEAGYIEVENLRIIVAAHGLAVIARGGGHV
jgi:hypothetical protein